jgi:hypothetical protein
VLIQQVVARLREWGGQIPQEITGREENVVFSMPKELRIPTRKCLKNIHCPNNRRTDKKDKSLSVPVFCSKNVTKY